jgi:nucleotide-binding universal stress UspA family protein
MIRALIATDGSAAATHALKTMLAVRTEFAQEPELHAVAVVDYAELPGNLTTAPESAPDLLASDAEAALTAAAEIARAAGVGLRVHLRRGHCVEQILALAREIHADVIVSGTHGRKGFERAVLGSTCEGLIRRSEVPVLAIKHERLRS